MKGVDIMTRSHIYLLKAVDHLIANDSRLAARIEVHLAGVLSDSDREIAQHSRIAHLHGYLPHTRRSRSSGRLTSYSCPCRICHADGDPPTVPGKVYEYLAAERPILAAVPEGDARDILLAGAHSLCRRARRHRCHGASNQRSAGETRKHADRESGRDRSLRVRTLSRKSPT